jgi:hypothetical protein
MLCCDYGPFDNYVSAHDLTNHIELVGLGESSLLNKCWQEQGPEPTVSDFPETLQVDIRWFRGKPGETK